MGGHRRAEHGTLLPHGDAAARWPSVDRWRRSAGRWSFQSAAIRSGRREVDADDQPAELRTFPTHGNVVGRWEGVNRGRFLWKRPNFNRRVVRCCNWDLDGDRVDDRRPPASQGDVVAQWE